MAFLLNLIIFQLAPPPTPLQDFEYHWRIIKNFYASDHDLPKVHISNTNVPFHLEELLQILIREQTSDQEKSELDSRECLEYLLDAKPLDLLVEKALSDTPPGIRVLTISWVRRFLSCTEDPPVTGNIFESIQVSMRYFQDIEGFFQRVYIAETLNALQWKWISL